MENKQIKKAPVNEVVAKGKKAADLQQDIQGFFKERDATNREGHEDVSALSQVENELKESLYLDSLKEVPISVTIEPMFNTMFVTAKRNKVSTAGGILISKTENKDGLEIEYQETQRVMAIGPQIQQASIGYQVVVNFEAFRQYTANNMAEKVTKKTRLEVPTVTIDGTDYLMISERDIKYIIKDEK